MPLQSGKSQKVVSQNIRELHTGNTYSRTAAKFGKERADKQAVAIALSKAREGRAFGGAVPGVGGMMLGGGLPSLTGTPAGIANLGAAIGSPGVNSASTGVSSPVQAPLRASGGGLGRVATPKMTPTWQERQEARNITRGPILSKVPGRTDAHATHVPSGSYVIPADIVSGRGQGNTIAGAHALQQMFKMGPYGASPGHIRGGRGAPPIPKGPTKFEKGGLVSHQTDKPVRVNLAGGEVVVPPENLLQVVHRDLKTAHEIMDRWVLNERKKLRKTLARLPGPVKDGTK